MAAADEKVIFSCPNCGKKYDAPFADVGKKGNCSNCNSRISVPKPPGKSSTKPLYPKAFLVIRIGAIGLLLFSYTEPPTGYYTLLRFIICATCAYGAYYAWKLERNVWVGTMAVVAVTFPNWLTPDGWEAQAIVAAILLLSIPLLRPGATDEAIQYILWGVVLILGAFGFWYSLLGNPFSEIRLILWGQEVPGFIVDTWEDVGDTDDGGTVWTHGYVYTYSIPSGREFRQSIDNRSGRLKAAFFDLEEPYPVKLEYLPGDPTISRLKGNGSQSVMEWLWRDIGLGGFLLVLFLSPGVAMLKIGVRLIRWRRLASAMERLELGMNKQKVKEILGEPHEVLANRWYYKHDGKKLWNALTLLFSSENKVYEIKPPIFKKMEE